MSTLRFSLPHTSHRVNTCRINKHLCTMTCWHQVFHCDVNPSNILVNTATSEILLVDWACSRQEASQTSKVSDCGASHHEYLNGTDYPLLKCICMYQIHMHDTDLAFVWCQSNALRNFYALSFKAGKTRLHLEPNKLDMDLFVQARVHHMCL
jgi:hypothetical protein